MAAGGPGSWAPDFGPFDRRVWLNCAHQGPLPRVAVEAAKNSLEDKINPSRIADEDFFRLPHALKRALARLIRVDARDVILGNSASYGLHILRNGLRWKPGDEVLSVTNEFPASIYPWMGLREQGVRVRLIKPRGPSLTAEELDSEVGPRTRLLCISWVNSFNGGVLDVARIGRVCKQNGTLFALNASQGVGARTISVESGPVDALVSCGTKWLCGPYGTGFAWFRSSFRETFESCQTYWLPNAWGGDLTRYRLRSDLGADAFDVFGTANFLNFAPWLASVRYLQSAGLRRIQQHNEALVDSLTRGATERGWRSLSPPEPKKRSAIVALTHPRPGSNGKIFASLQKSGIDVALRAGSLRFSPHLYNIPEDIERALSIMGHS
ncbi:MAG: aminotransferase class V-fold PLP-dependent enzyme [Thermoplasmata archaeon]